MPEGPLLVSPDRTAKSIFREVIIKKPHLFKISCLSDVLSLFPANSEPFYAGFGNRDTDAISYRAVAINLGKIFIINPGGEVKQFHNMYIKSYPEIDKLVDVMFPSITVVNRDIESQQDDISPET